MIFELPDDFDLKKTAEDRLELTQKIRCYFRSYSKVWKRISDHIHGSGQTCPLFNIPADYEFVYHRGTGASISFRDINLYAEPWNEDKTGFLPRDVFGLEVEIEIVHKDDSGLDRPRTQQLKRELLVPFALETDFSEEAYQAWVETQVERDKSSLEYEVECLAEKIGDRLSIEKVKEIFEKAREVEKSK